MAAQATLVAYDGESTPIQHSFQVAGVENIGGETLAYYREAITTVPLDAQGRVTLKKKVLASGIHRLAARVEIPIMESISGQNSSGYTAPPKVAYINTMENVGFFSPRATITGKRNVRMLMHNMLNGITTSVALGTSGPFADLFDNSIAPS